MINLYSIIVYTRDNISGVERKRKRFFLPSFLPSTEARWWRGGEVMPGTLEAFLAFSSCNVYIRGPHTLMEYIRKIRVTLGR